MQILINQIGYQKDLPKRAVVQSASVPTATQFTLLDATGTVVFTGTVAPVGPVAHWHTGQYATLDFSAFRGTGRFVLRLTEGEQVVDSPRFTIDTGSMALRLTSALTYWFKGQRASGEWAASDAAARFQGPREGTWDVSGGWFDATGDVGVHLTHQSHTAYYNPQQAGFSAYAFYQLAEQLADGPEDYAVVLRRILDEANYGSDSLMRRLVPTRAFIKSVDRPDAFAVVSDSRAMAYELHHSSDQFGEAETRDAETVTDLNYETSFRAGGGTTIAALAIAGRHYYPGAAFTQEAKIQAAKDAYRYLNAHNNELTNDGKTNLVDAYCALLAATELFKTTAEYGYLLQARGWAKRIADAGTSFDGTWWLAVDQDMPFFHPADEGLPVLALLLYAAVEKDAAAQAAAIATATRAMTALLAVSHAVNNPFDYPRLLAKNDPKDRLRAQFFFPHHTAAAPWWQGENARLASLATAAFKLAEVTEDADLAAALTAFGQAQLNWIAGCNPFDSSMIEGFGRNHIQYHFGQREDFLNAPGGIVNGITSGITDEGDIAFVRGPEEGVADNWRWAEQWIPHVSWALLALGQLTHLQQKR
ncbi:glycoside hydrolase family 9 protein [Lacticaseibacillus kribbianus]|uniref:glycoside hydrolase family 9 protein n=1 Tax=Lacticaseibacillus kribbianus TaxID=2926292 RepID=UPI001CD288A6|nr:glycoside hydrolase family 9 protein [Lacticaseibacillus kribbianus]